MGLVQNYPYNDVEEDPFLVVNYNNMINTSFKQYIYHQVIIKTYI